MMMSEGYFVTSKLLCQLKNLVSSVSGTKDTRGVPVACSGIKRSGEHMELHASFGTKVFQILSVTLVVDVSHPNVYGADSDTGSVYPLSSGHELREQKRIFTTRQCNKNMVSVSQELIADGGFIETSLDTLLNGRLLHLSWKEL